MSEYKNFQGQYPLGNRKFCCQCAASSFEEAQEIMDRWEIGAVVDGYGETQVRVPQPGEEGFPHWLIFISWLAMNQGVFSTSFFADDGLIHELLHLHEKVELVGEDPMREYEKLCKELGLLPP